MFSLQAVINIQIPKITKPPTPKTRASFSTEEEKERKRKEEERKKAEEDARKLAEGWQGVIDGDAVEEKVFNKLRKALKNSNVKNTLVINGWEVMGRKKTGKELDVYLDHEVKDPLIKRREHDFLIISDPLKTVFHIEAKKSKKERHSAAQQLQSGLEFFTQYFVLPKQGKWNFVRIMYIGEKIDVCRNCHEFVFTPDTNLDEWWKKLEPQNQEKRSLEKDSSLDECSYIQNCKFLLHQLFKKSQVITEADITDNSEDFIGKSCDPDMHKNEKDKKGSCFLTRVQHSLLNDPSMKRVMFNSAYGTGKTLLIKSKAKELLLKGEKVVIVLFDDVKTTFQFLLKKNYDQEFEEGPCKDNVKVVIIKSAGDIIFFRKKNF